MKIPHTTNKNQTPAAELHAQLRQVRWQKSRYSNSQGSCVEMGLLPGGDIAVRNSRDPDGPALIYTQAEIQALLHGAKDGDFDDLLR
jgi:capsid protein